MTSLHRHVFIGKTRIRPVVVGIQLNAKSLKSEKNKTLHQSMSNRGSESYSKAVPYTPCRP
jgi:hypothetical protein